MLSEELTSAEALFGGIQYQPITVSQAVGWLRLAQSAQDAELEQYTREDIVLTPTVPNQIQVGLSARFRPQHPFISMTLQATAALVTGELQTPLCHVALLCHTRGTPNMAVKGEFYSRLLHHIDQLVFLDVSTEVSFMFV